MSRQLSGWRPMFAVGFCLVFVTAFGGCKPSEPIRIGFVGGISGRVADLGVAGRDALQLAVEHRNQAGGVSGRQVRIIVKNDEQQPEVARRVVQELIGEGAVAIVGPMTSDMGVAVAPLVDRAKVLMVSPTVTTEALTGIDDHFFRVSSTTRHFSSRNALYQIKTGAMRRVAAAYDLGNKTFTENWLKNFTEAFTPGGGEVLTALGFQTGGDTTFLEIARGLLAVRPDGVLIVANSMDSALLCQQIRKLDQHLPVTLADWGATERLIEMGGKAVEGVTVVQTFDRNSSAPRYRDFRRIYLERFNREPGFPGVYSYDAANVVMDALAKQQDGQSLKDAVLSLREFQGLQSSFSFDDFGDVKRPHASISVVRDGKFVVVE